MHSLCIRPTTQGELSDKRENCLLQPLLLRAKQWLRTLPQSARSCSSRGQEKSRKVQHQLRQDGAQKEHHGQLKSRRLLLRGSRLLKRGCCRGGERQGPVATTIVVARRPTAGLHPGLSCTRIQQAGFPVRTRQLAHRGLHRHRIDLSVFGAARWGRLH